MFQMSPIMGDTNHVLHCPSETRDQTQKEAFTVLNAHFEKQHTPSILTDILCDRLTTGFTTDVSYHHNETTMINQLLWPSPLLLTLRKRLDGINFSVANCQRHGSPQSTYTTTNGNPDTCSHLISGCAKP